jgi:hypothetical protein
MYDKNRGIKYVVHLQYTYTIKTDQTNTITAL